MHAFLQRNRNYFSLILLGAALMGGNLTAQNAQSAQGGAVPGFVRGSLHSANQAPVAGIVASAATDIVILGGGLEQGLRPGMVCQIGRGFKEVGELIIIEARSNRSAALIMELSENSSIQVGDIARIKTLQNS